MDVKKQKKDSLLSRAVQEGSSARLSVTPMWSESLAALYKNEQIAKGGEEFATKFEYKHHSIPYL